MLLSSLPETLSRRLVGLSCVLDRRSAPRFAALLLGVLLATGRRTVSSWIRASGQSDSYRNAYTALASAGRRPDSVAVRLLTGPLKSLLPTSGRLLLAIDDTPTKRHGPHVQGAGFHHNPTPGPAGGRFLYGHFRVTLAWLAEHPRHGTIAMPLLARLYVREKDLPAWLGLGELFLRCQRWADLAGVVAQIRRRSELAAETLRRRGQTSRGEYAAARWTLSQLAEAHPEAVWPRVFLSHCLLQQGEDWTAAERALLDVLRLDPRNAQALSNLDLLRQRHGVGTPSS